MPSIATRISPLAGVLRQGRFGAARPEIGVFLSVVHPLSIVTIGARAGKAKALDTALKKHYGTAAPAPGTSAEGRGVVFHWSGPEQYYAIAGGLGEGELYRELQDRLAGLASCMDQSHGRVVFSVSGPRAREVLAKGTPVDLHARAFGAGRSAVTQMAHVGVHLAQVGADEFELSVFRGFSESFWEWLTQMSAEFGYQVS